LEADDFVEKMQSRLHEIREQMEDAQDTMVYQANLLRREHRYTIGDRVVLDTHK
jgi:hypothetical protein